MYSQHIKYDKDYRIIEYIENDSDGNIIIHRRYNSLGKITYDLYEVNQWVKYYYRKGYLVRKKYSDGSISYFRYKKGILKAMLTDDRKKIDLYI